MEVKVACSGNCSCIGSIGVVVAVVLQYWSCYGSNWDAGDEGQTCVKLVSIYPFQLNLSSNVSLHFITPREAVIKRGFISI